MMALDLQSFIKDQSLCRFARRTVDSSLQRMTALSPDVIQQLSLLCKYAYYGEQEDSLIQKIHEKAYTLFQSPLWEDLTHYHYTYINHFLYISRSALKYQEVNKKKKEFSLKCLNIMINGPYISSIEWLPSRLIEIHHLLEDLKLTIPLGLQMSLSTMDFLKHSVGLWKWTPLNHEAFKAYALYALSKDSNDLPVVKTISQLQVKSSIKRKEISEMIDYLFILRQLGEIEFQALQGALNLVKKEHITEKTALPFWLLVHQRKEI